MCSKAKSESQSKSNLKPNIIGSFFIGAVKFYQRYIGILFPPACRFYPSCSEYALEAIHSHGAAYGFYLTVRRILKCHPFHEGGFDPVPESHSKN